MSAHTPGPWTMKPHWWGGAGGSTQGGCFSIEDAQENVLCSRTPWDEKAEEMRANGRLIAAAPDLLEALKEALIGLAAAENNRAARFAEQKARAAIAKATEAK